MNFRTIPAVIARKFVLMGVTFVVGLFVVSNCLYIEFLNSQCDSLPNQEWYNGDPSNGPVKWRSSSLTNEQVWREVFLQMEHADYETRILTDSQKSQMAKDIRRAVANNKLRSFTGSWGCFSTLQCHCWRSSRSRAFGIQVAGVWFMGWLCFWRLPLGGVCMLLPICRALDGDTRNLTNAQSRSAYPYADP